MARTQDKPRLLSPAFLKLLSGLEVNGGKVKRSSLGGRSSLGKVETAERAAELGLVALDGAHVVLLEPGKAALTGERGK